MLTQEEIIAIRARDRQDIFVGTLFSAIFHVVLLYVKIPEGQARIFDSSQKKVVTIRRFKPPKKKLAPKQKKIIKKKRTKPKPIPDPTPDEPEPVVEPEPDPDIDLIPPDVEIIFGEPEGPPLDMGDSGPIRIGVDGVQPKILKQVDPLYPEMARRARVQGIVILEAVIQRNGRVGDIRVLRGLGKSGCNEAAVKALKKWKFEPGYINGRPVDAYMTLTVRFQLK